MNQLSYQSESSPEYHQPRHAAQPFVRNRVAVLAIAGATVFEARVANQSWPPSNQYEATVFATAALGTLLTVITGVGSLYASAADKRANHSSGLEIFDPQN